MVLIMDTFMVFIIKDIIMGVVINITIILEIKIKDIIIKVTKFKLDIVITIIVGVVIVLFIELKDIMMVEVAINIKVAKVIAIINIIAMNNFMHKY